MTKKELDALFTRRKNAYDECNAIMNGATTEEGEKRDLNSEEEERYDKAWKEVETCNKIVERHEKLEKVKKDHLDKLQSEPSGLEAEEEGREDKEAEEKRIEQLMDTEFRNWIATGEKPSSDEYRTLQVDSDTLGGYLVAPHQFVQGLLKEIDNQVFVRNYATKHEVRLSVGLGIPTIDSDPDDADWTSELATGSETNMEFGARELTPRPLAKRTKISNKLLRNSSRPIEMIVRDRLSYKFGVSEENAFLTGHGSQQPLGVFTPSSDGISTNRDINTGHATQITADGLIDAQYGLKGAYWRRARWLLNRTVLKEVAKLKDTDGQYLWRVGLQAGSPNTLLGMPIDMSEYSPNTFSTNNYIGLLGDWSYYYIVDALFFQMMRLVEKYAETNETGFIARKELDGMPVLEEAFVRLKLSA